MKTELLPNTSKLGAKDTNLDVLARIAFPQPKKTTKRPSLNLSLALDQSGSMATNDAFGQAKQAALNLLARLEATDRIAVVLYNGLPRVILPSCPVSEARSRLQILLANERAGGSTALHAGWLAAAEQAAPFVNEYDVSRVLLLSDGQATDGKCNPSDLKEEAHQLLAAGISTATYGLGMHFNEELMTEMAAGGPARFAQDADQLTPYFGADFDLLAQTVAPIVKLRITARAGKKKIDVTLLNDYSLDADGYWRLPAGVSGAESWAALQLDVSKSGANSVEINAEWLWKDMTGKETKTAQAIEIGHGKGKKNDAVIERCAEARAAKMAKEAAAAARMGDFAQASHTIGLMRSLSGSNAYINSVSDNLDGLVRTRNAVGLAKEAMYSSTTMSNRVAEIGESATLLSADRFGLRKAVQGLHNAEKKEENATESK
jgi:Ca-activated chloride channel family protein